MTEIRIIGDRSGRVWRQVLQAVWDSRHGGRRVVLYVPEQYTLQAERDLITGLNLPGLLDIRVVSPRKLKMQVKEAAGSGEKQTLDECGRLMAVHRAMTEQGPELTYYRDMTGLPGAVLRVGNALSELQESGLTGEELKTYAEEAATASERSKMKDMSLIWEGYSRLTGENLRDEREAWTDMLARLRESRLWEGADIAVYGFDTIRPDLRELLVCAAACANSVKVFMTMDSPQAPDGALFSMQHLTIRRLKNDLEEQGGRIETVYPQTEREGCAPPLLWLDRYLFAGDSRPFPGDAGRTVTLYAAPSAAEEAEEIVRALEEWRREGIPWEKMMIAQPRGSMLDSALRGSLERHGIPHWFSRRESVLSHPLAEMLLAALNCADEGYRTEWMLDLTRSGFSPLTEEEGLTLEEYAAAYGIEGDRWKKPFTLGDAAEEAERLRQRLTAPVERLKEELGKAAPADRALEALVRFLEAGNAWEKLTDREARLLEGKLYREALINRQIWQWLTDLLDEMWVLLGERQVTAGELRGMIESAMNTAALAALPIDTSGVMIGEAGHLLASNAEALVLPQAAEGIMTPPDSGWVSDRERDRIEAETGKTVGLSREQEVQVRRYDYYRTLTLPSKYLKITWSLRGEDGSTHQPDALVARIRELFPTVKEDGGYTASARQAKPETPMTAADGMGLKLREMREENKTEAGPEWEKAMIALLHDREYGPTARRILEEAKEKREERRIEPDTAKRLFMTDRMSVSRLEGYAECPYRHFIDYGLRPVRQETFEFENTDAGTFFHEALDRYLRTAAAETGWPDLRQERVDSLMDEILADLTKEWENSPLGQDALGEWQAETYIRRVRHAAGVLTRFAGNSDFRTIATEQAFGEEEGLKPVILTLRDGSRVAIRGKIDRIDTYRNGEGVWLRVVDNKSRGKKPDPARMASGEQLQLMIYLKAAAQAEPDARLAGALYFPVQDPEVELPGDDREAAEKERLSKVRMKGLVTADEDVVRAMDRDIRPYSVDKVFNDNGSVSKTAPWAVDEKTLRALTDAAAEKAADLCGRIREGDIAVSPSSDGKASVCRYCDYCTICRVRPGDERKPDPDITFQDLARKNTLHE